MAQLEDVLALVISLKRRLEKSIENGKKTALPKRTPEFFEHKMAELKARWEEFLAADLAINNYIITNTIKKPIEYIEEDQYSAIETKYVEYIAELLANLRKCSKTTETKSTVIPKDSTTVLQTESLLPKIPLPKFNGDYDMWRSFRDLFISLVHSNLRLTNVQKFHHLKTCLTGEAERVLRHTPITEDSYESAWTKLQERFENTRILVDHQLKRLVNQPKLTIESSNGIKLLIDTTEECLQQLNDLKVDTNSWDVLLIYILVQKLPFITLKLWKEDLGSSKELPSLDQFKAFLNKRLKVLESIADAIGAKSSINKPTFKDKTTVHHTLREDKCLACEQQHYVTKCPQYKGLTVKARRKLISAAGRCLNCLSRQHSVANCSSKFRCFKCNKAHHTTLHEDTDYTCKNKSKGNQIHQTDSSQTKQGNSNDESKTTQAFVTRQNLRALLSTALVTAHADPHKSSILRCLIDPGSQSSFITEDACKRLGATCNPTAISITGIGTTTASASRETILHLHSNQRQGIKIQETFLVLNKITDPLPRHRISKGEYQHIIGLQLADPTFWKPGKIDALLGANVFAQILETGIIRGSNKAPVAIKTTLGWILLGPATSSSHIASFIATTDSEMNTQLKQFWEMEEFPSPSVMRKEEAECQAIYKATTKRLENGTYQVKLPFVHDETPQLGESRPQALLRLKALQKQFVKRPGLAEDYTKCLNEYIKLGHMDIVDPISDNTPNYYIPHHAVFKESTTTRLRVVFDASCKTSNGKSLNNYMLTGPTLQPKLFATLLKWRKYKTVITADIEKMYRMIMVQPDQRDLQRILWQHPITKEVQDYRLNTVTFGTTAAPYLAIRTLQQLAEDEKKKWPLASKATMTSFYVDDLLTGADTIQEAKELQTQLIAMLNSANFSLRKWSSNHDELVAHFPPEHRELKDTLAFGDQESIKTLGVRWNPKEDYFFFKINLRADSNTITKRGILSEVATLYDPLGWLAPVIIIAKILIQTLWITGCSWDSQVSDSVKEKWTTFKGDLENLTCLKIPRWIRCTNKTSIQLHGFCDASERAYAAVVYLRSVQEDGSISTMLLTSKTRVAPTKPLTIPRLELNGALILARLITTTIKDMEFTSIPVFAWTDSTIVLQWIREHPSRWKSYVANRVVEIQDSIKYDCWQHVRTDQNPADLASRGSTVADLSTKNLWWHGPEWLRKPQDDWPKIAKLNDKTELEAKKNKVAIFKIEVTDNILLRFSSFNRLIRVVALLLRFKHNCKTCPDARALGDVTSNEWLQAKTAVIRLVQKESFPIDYGNLIRKKPLARKSKLLQLNPYLDDQGLMRIYGRLSNASISFNSKHQVILPKNHHVTQLIIRQIHNETFHGGTSLVLATSRNQFWILDARRAISKEISKCITCFRHQKTACTQLMGHLPEARVNMTKPFCKVGIDYAGPLTIKASLLRKAKLLKAYLCIFVCMATKAIHIEVVSALTSEAFLAALKRFVSRRGLCTDLYSDCGTNFVGAKYMLDKDIKRAIATATPIAAQYLLTQGVNWHFNPPAAPHFGGIWEAGVKSIKNHLKRSLGTMICTFEEYVTITTQIECCLNSRPLGYITSNPNEPEILTPGHFLIGQALNAVPEPDHSNGIVSTSARWKYLQQRLQQFWKRWSTEYIHQLQTRPKWQQVQANLKIGDIVLIKNEKMSPAKWPLGIIIQVFPGADQLVRVVQVKVQNTVYKRPIHKLSKLPIMA